MVCDAGNTNRLVRFFFQERGIWGGRVQNTLMIAGGGPGAKHQNTSEVFEVLK